MSKTWAPCVGSSCAGGFGPSHWVACYTSICGPAAQLQLLTRISPRAQGSLPEALAPVLSQPLPGDGKVEPVVDVLVGGLFCLNYR